MARRIEIDLPLVRGETPYEELDVVFRMNSEYDPKVAAKKFYDVFKGMPSGTWVELMGIDEFRDIYEEYAIRIPRETRD